jgi:nucleotide sugar dehydrogenase
MPDMPVNLKQIFIWGLGNVGRMLAFDYASQGAHVVGVDIHSELVESLNHRGLAETVSVRADAQVLNFKAVTPGDIDGARADAVHFIAPRVSLDENGSADFAALDSIVDTLSRLIGIGSLVFLVSTVPIGTTRQRVANRLHQLTGFSPGIDFHVGFLPERLQVGSAFSDHLRHPRLFGPVDPSSSVVIRKFMHQYARDKSNLDECVSSEEAELTKLAENVYRDVNIAFANELAIVCQANKLDVRSVISKANKVDICHIHQPGAWVGGHCIPVYPYLFSEQSEMSASVAMQTRKYNESILEFVLDELRPVLCQYRNETIAIFGLSFKPNIKDPTNSLGLEIARRLNSEFESIRVRDERYSSSEIIEMGFSPLEPPERFGAAIFCCGHDEYRSFLSEQGNGSALIADLVGILDLQQKTSGKDIFVFGRGWISKS